MKTLRFLLIWLFLVIPCQAEIISVSDEGSGSIQAAIDAANNGDIVEIAPGIYKGGGNRDIDFKGKSIILRSTEPDCPDLVIIDCESTQTDQHRAFYFHNSEDAGSVLNGITIKNGYTNNGGAVYCDNSSPVIKNCRFIDCTAENWGGAIYCWEASPRISNCTFTGNSAFEGGAISTYSYWNHLCAPRIENCRIFCNSASGSGGGINSDCLSSPVIANCLISRNYAGTYGGGGISIFQSNPTIINCTIVDNLTESSGSGILQWYEFENGSTVENCILWDNTFAWAPQFPWPGPSGPQITLGSEMTVSYCDIEEMWIETLPAATLNLGEGNIDVPPYFVAPLNGDYHLMEPSVCIDRVNPAYHPPVEETDIDGQARLMGFAVDMGADEFGFEGPPVFNVPPIACITGGDRTVEADNCDGARVILQGFCSSSQEFPPCNSNQIVHFDWYQLDPFNPAPFEIYLGSGESIDCNLFFGENRVILEATTMAGLFDRCEATITVVDTTPPVIELNGPSVVVFGACGTNSYTEQGATATDICGSVQVAIGGDVVDVSTAGTYVVTYDAIDFPGNAAEQVTRTVIVEQDSTIPDFNLSVSPAYLWPPDQKMVEITPNWTVSDNCTEVPQVSLVGVTINEGNDTDAGNDVYIGDDGAIYLRARRSGTAGDRIYTITYQAVDDSGNTAVQSAEVVVPHDQRKPK